MAHADMAMSSSEMGVVLPESPTAEIIANGNFENCASAPEVYEDIASELV
jgi:hypothetical protein